MLDQVDIDPESPNETKRRDAHVTERFFFDEILPMIASGKISTGWISVEENFKKAIWIKAVSSLGERTEDEREVDRYFFELVRSKWPQARFYLLEWAEKRTWAPFESWEIEEKPSTSSNSELILKKGRLPPQLCSNCMQRALDDLRESHVGEAKAADSFFETWMPDASLNYLKRLLLQRLIMNYGLKRHFPSDLDALELSGTGDNARLIAHEFKRKDPCPNGAYLVPEGRRVDKWKLIKLRKKLKGKTAANFKQAVTSFASEESAVQQSGEKFYGLDTVHMGFVEFCSKMKIQYLHSVWDSRASEKKSPRLEELFMNPNQIASEVVIFSKALEPTSFVGFSANRGQDAGTKKITKSKERVQGVIKAPSSLSKEAAEVSGYQRIALKA